MLFRSYLIELCEVSKPTTNTIDDMTTHIDMISNKSTTINQLLQLLDNTLLGIADTSDIKICGKSIYEKQTIADKLVTYLSVEYLNVNNQADITKLELIQTQISKKQELITELFNLIVAQDAFNHSTLTLNKGHKLQEDAYKILEFCPVCHNKLA